MYSTLNMNLTSWDLPDDDFDHTQLDANWKKLDRHDHTPGRGPQIPTAGIAVKAISSDRIADGAVTNLQLAANAVATANVQAQAITTALLATGAVTNAILGDRAVTLDKLDPTILPLGSVMLWYRAPGSGAAPAGGWEVMDGRAWSAIPNLMGLTTGSIPNMVDVFPRGTDLLHAGTTGGSNTTSAAHSHTVPPHSHTVPAHVHGITPDGDHMHLWQGGLHMGARTNAFDVNASFQNIDGHRWQNTYYTMYIQNLLSNEMWSRRIWGGRGGVALTDGVADMDEAGEHAHGYQTAPSGALTTSAPSAYTDSQLGDLAIVPPYVGLVFIMRVR